MRRLGGVLAALLFVAACSSTPPPPLVPSNEITPIPQGPALKEVILGVDDVAGGYNPHTLAGQSAITTALSSLLLPSAFRPAADGTPEINRTLLLSAQVTKTEPFTVTYTLRRDASWSDGAPIAAEDFVYLWQRMRTEPGVVDPAGYRLISDIASREGGKVVEVTFAKPYPGWRSLFGSLLPAHLLKDAPGSWSNVLATGFPATAGPFAIKQLDEPRGEVVLERNDRYWETPTSLDRLVLRRAEHGQMKKALEDGDNQAALLRADAIAVNLLQAVPGLTTKVVPRNEVVQLLLRPASPRLADVKVRTAILAALDRNALIATGTEGGPAMQFRADSMVVPPSRPGYVPAIPQNTLDIAATERLLTEAGYARSATGRWERGGKPLSLTIAAPERVEPYAMIAQQVQRQLTSVGIAATVVTPNAEELFGRVLSRNGASTDDTIDIAVVPRVDAGDSTSALASTFGCVTATPDGSTPSPANLAGFCDPEIQSTIDAALNGQTMLAAAIAKVEPLLWQQAVAVPLFQVVDLLAVLPSTVSGLDAGAPLAGVLSDAPEWRRLDR